MLAKSSDVAGVSCKTFAKYWENGVEFGGPPFRPFLMFLFINFVPCACEHPWEFEISADNAKVTGGVRVSVTFKDIQFCQLLLGLWLRSGYSITNRRR